MENPQHFECDTPDCCYWSEVGCTKGTAITIQEHHCVDYEEQPKPGSLTVTIEVQGGLVANVYASRISPRSALSYWTWTTRPPRPPPISGGRNGCLQPPQRHTTTSTDWRTITSCCSE